MSEGGGFRAPTVEELQKHFTQFRIEKYVAGGGMGAVYRATQVSVDRTVAIKILPPELARDEKFRERFAMEAKAMAKLSHPNVVQLYDFGQDGDIVWMAQEWISGRTVEDVLLEEGALAPAEAAALVAQACEGLGYAHRQGIVHRDVKPANMMEDRAGRVKVMDFGLARATHGDEPSLRADTGERYATTEYAGPEIWELDREPDHRVDIFALGVLLFEALTGTRPTETFRAPSQVRPGLDPRYDAIVIRSLQRKPENRYDSCEEFLAALREVVTTPTSDPPVATPVRSADKQEPLALAEPVAPPARPAAVAAAPTTAPAQPRSLSASVRKPRKRASAGWLVTGVLMVGAASGMIWLYVSGAGLADSTEPVAPVAPVKPAETPQQRVERKAREQFRRLERMEVEQKAKAKKEEARKKAENNQEGENNKRKQPNKTPPPKDTPPPK